MTARRIPRPDVPGGYAPLDSGLLVPRANMQDCDWLPRDHGLIAWTYDPQIIMGSTVLAVAGRLYLQRIHVWRSALVRNLVVYVTAGSGLTSGQCGAALFDAATGALLGRTGDQASSWGTTGVKEMPLSAPVQLSAGDVYTGLWFNGKTGPNIPRVQSTTALMNLGRASADARWGYVATGLTTDPPDVLGTIVANSPSYWSALS